MKGRSGPARTAARIVGDSHARKLLPLQAFHSAGEALFGLSLVGSLFFNVSVDAARPRILLYLAVTMAPFAIIGPLIGPVIDQVRFGHRGVLALSLGARSVVALLLASQLQSLLLYPEAFVIVVLAKVFAVSRNALVPVLVGDRDHLVVVNARLARVAAIAGGLGAAAGVGVLRLADAGAVLRLGAAMYLVGALFALRIPAPHPEQNASPIIEVTEMHGPGVQLATTAMIAVRSAVGFSLFHIGFSLKSVGEPAWVLGLVAAGGSVGSFVGTYVAPRLRRRVDEQSMLTVGLLVATVFAFVAALRVHGVTAFLLTFALGTGGSVGRRAFDGVVQTEAPHARRGQAYAGLETRLELAWVGGAIVAVITRTPAWVGLAGLTVGLGAVAGTRLIRRFDAARRSLAVAGSATLPLRLLETAEGLLAVGDSPQAALVAMAAADTCGARDGDARMVLDRLAARASDPEAVGHEFADEAANELVRRVRDLVAEEMAARGSAGEER